MAISLYDASVTSFLQVLTAAGDFLERGLSHCQDNNIDPAEIVETRLYPDMHPFRFQVVWITHHSLGAMRGVEAGLFGSPSVTRFAEAGLPQSPGAPAALDYAGLQALVAETRAGLKQLDPAQVNALEGRDVSFEFGEIKLPFTAEGFLMSFSLPNLHFHATTAYDILRSRGVPLGKRDYLGPMRMKA